jgi:hypothetical protein
MKNVKEKKWLTMKQVIALTDIRAATINRYKDDFADFIKYRYNASQMLEFSEDSIPMLKKIYALYRDTSSGRMTTKKVKLALIQQMEEEVAVTIDMNEITTNSPQNTDRALTQQNPLFRYLSRQEKRLSVLEEQNKKILDQQENMITNQETMKQIMNQHLQLLSKLARTRMQERKQTIWQRIFGVKQTSSIDP